MSRVVCVALNPAIDVSSEAEIVRPTKKTRTHDQRIHAGGGGTNVARVIDDLGGSVELLYLNGGATASLFESCLAPYSFARQSFPTAGDTRIALMVYENHSGFEYRFVPEGPEVDASEVEPVLIALEAVEADYIVASGSLPLGLPDNTYARIADIARRKGSRFVLDTSGAPLRMTLDTGGVFLVKPSMSELETIVGRHLDERGASEAAASVVASGAAENVAVSMGRSGALLATAGGVIRVPAIRVHEKSAVGAGDSFLAAIVWALSEGHGIRDAFHFGVAAGSAAAMTPGTELCRRDDIFALFGGWGQPA